MKELDDDEEKTMTMEESNWAEVLCVNVQDDNKEETKSQKVSLNHVEDPNIRERARKLVENYRRR